MSVWVNKQKRKKTDRGRVKEERRGGGGRRVGGGGRSKHRRGRIRSSRGNWSRRRKLELAVASAAELHCSARTVTEALREKCV